MPVSDFMYMKFLLKSSRKFIFSILYQKDPSWRKSRQVRSISINFVYGSLQVAFTI